MPLARVISGGQTGVDQAALRAAKKCGLLTGGWIPQGYRTLDGDDPSLHKYGLIEHASRAYPPRTKLNIEESDGTLQIAADFSSPGEILTHRLMRESGKPGFVLSIDNMPMIDVPHLVIVSWIRKHDISVLNVAGNSEQTVPGIGQIVEEYLIKVFRKARKK